jgi:hypothetical protein
VQREVIVDQTLQVDGLTVESPFHVRGWHAGSDTRNIDVHVPFGLYSGVEITDGRGHTYSMKCDGIPIHIDFM